MKRQMDFQAESFIRERKRHTWLRRAIALLCAVVMLLTMNSLKMNADTLEHIPGCGLEEHRHTLACYPLVCPLAEAEPQYEIRRAFTGDVRPHVHSEDCYDDSGNLACGYVESLYYHVHNRWCYDDGGNLVCGLSEIQPHVHTEACYQDVPTLICGQDEYPAHHHTQDCYFTVRELACGLEENPGHIHTAECYYDHNELTCGLEESVGHIHTADCYIPVVETTCGMEEGPGHIHTAECFTRELVCGELESEAHQHTDACYADVLTCEIPEGYGAHTHSESCYTVYNILVCGIPEGEGAHTHTRDCVTSYHTLVCGIPEGEGAHTHTDNCYVNYDYLVCGQEETEGHTHTDACYEHTSELICGEQDGSEWVAMMLGQEGVQVHTHTAECFTTITRNVNGEERTLRFATCGYQEIPTITCQESDWTSYPVLVSEGHAHTDACYDLTAEPICGMVEHEHTDACYQTRPVKAGATPAEGGNGDANSADLADLMEDTGSENGENETDGQLDDPSAETNADGDLDEVENATQVDNDENEAENQEQTEIGNEDSADLDALTGDIAEGGLSDAENGDVIDAETPAEGALIDEPADGEPSDIEAADADEAANIDAAEGELTDGTADGEPSDIEAADGEPTDGESGEPSDEESDETVDGEPTDEESDEPTEGETTDEESGEPTDEESGESSDEESDETADEESGEPSNEESGETTDKESDETADGETTDEESGETTDEETDKTADEESGETTDEESDETTDGESTDEESGEPSDEESGETTDKESDKTADETTDEESGEPTDEESNETADGEPSDEESDETADGEPSDEETDETADGEPTDEESDEPTEFTAGERVIEVKDGSVTLTWGPEAEIPGDVRVEVIEIERGTTDYDILYNNAMAALSEKKDTETTTQVMRFFDITLYAGEDTIEPKAAISVTVQVNEAEATDNDADVDAVHMEDVGAQATVVEATTDSDTVSFEAESFSIYGVVVDVPATEAEEPPVSVAVDLSSVDLMAAAEVTDTVSLSIPELLAGTDENAVKVEGDLSVEPEALLEGAEITASEGVQVDGNRLVLPTDALESGAVSLEMTTYATNDDYETVATTHKVDIELSDYQGRTDVAEGENITVEALEGNSLPADAVPVVSQKEGEVPEEIVAPEAPNEASAIFDITVKNGNGEGEEISNTGAVVVTVTPENLNVLDALPEGADPKDVKFELFHVHDGVTTPIELDEGAVVVNEEGKVEQFTFETDGFSDFILKFTVEFHNGDKEVYLPGGSQALLSTLIEGLGLVRANGTTFTVDEVANVEFVTPDLFSVEEVTQSPALVNDEEVPFFTEHDFLITSLLPFEEDRMILTMIDGEVIEVRVTDDLEGYVNIAFTDGGAPETNPTFSKRLFFVGQVYNNGGAKAYAEILPGSSSLNIDAFKSSANDESCLLNGDYEPKYLMIYEYTGSENGDITWSELDAHSNKLEFGDKHYITVGGHKFNMPTSRASNNDPYYHITAEKLDTYVVKVQFYNQNDVGEKPSGNYYVYAAIRKKNGNRSSIYYNIQPLSIDASGYAQVDISEFTRNNGANPSFYPMSASDAVTLLLVKNENANFVAMDSDNEGAITGGTVIENGSVVDGYGFTRTDGIGETTFTATKAKPYTYSVQVFDKNGETESLDLNDQHWYVYAEVNHPDGKYIYVKQLVGNETNVEIDKLYKRDAATGDNAVQNARNAPTTIPATGEVVTFALLRAKMESENSETNNPENLVCWRNNGVLWGYFATTDHMNVMALNGASVANRYTLRVEPGTQHSTLKLVQGGDAEITVESYNGTTKETAPSLDTTGSYFIVGKMYFSDGTEHKSRYYVKKLESGNLSATIDAGFADGDGSDVQFLTGTRSYEPMLVFVPNNTTITADQVRQKLAAPSDEDNIEIYRSGDVLLSYRLTAESGNLQAPNTTIRLDKLPSLKSKGQVEDANVSDTANLYILAEIDRGGVKSYAWRAFSTNPLPEGSFGDFETEGGATVYYREEDKVNFYIVKSGSAIDSVSQALAASRFAAGQLVQVGGATYKIGFAFNKTTSTVNATLTKYTPPTPSEYTVRVELLNATQDGPEPPDPEITDDYKVLAVLTSKDEATLGQPVAWALLDVDERDLNGSAAAFEGIIGTSAFNVCDANMNATGQTIGYNAGAYDIDLHLYHKASWPSEPTYAQIVAAESTAPEGYDLKGVFTADKPDPDKPSEDIGSKRAIIRLHSEYARSYSVRAKINTAGLSISQDEEYYVRVRLNHSNGGTYYAFAKLVVNDGQTVANLDFVTYKINNVDTIWYNSNGTNLQSAVTYTGDEGTTELEIISVKHGQSFSTAECVKPVGSNVPYTIVKFGESINMYTATRGERELAENLGTQTVVVYDVVDFTRDTEGVSKGAIDGYLETATDFGLYTITLSLHATDMESNIGAQHLTGAIGADYGFSGNNLQVNRVKVVKKYVTSSGDPVSGKTVTLRLYPVLQEVPLRLGAPKTDVNGHVDATYTTGADGTVQIIFDRLPAGKYLLKEVIDGVEYEYASGANGVVVLGDGRTVKFSERFIEIENININYNYFGDIDDGVALNPILERSRHGVIVVNDSEDYRRLSGANGQGQATVVKAGTDSKYPVLDIASDINIRLNELSRKLATSTNSKTVRYMTVTPEELNSTSYLDLKDDGRYIVVNVDMSRAGGAATVRLKAALNGHTLQADFGQGGGEDSSKVLFNFITYDAHGNPQPYTGKISTVDIGSGVLLAPSAIVADLGGNFGGTIVCREAQHTGSEIHSDSQNKIQNKNTVLTNSNGRINTGDLNIIKSVEGTSDRTTWFTFQVTLTDGNEQPLTGTKSYAVSGQPGTITSIAFVNGVALVKVRAGERALISGIPAGYHFSVQEVETDESEHYSVKDVKVNGRIKASEVADGVIVKDNTANAEFTNKKKTGGLKVTKIVESPIPADKTQNYDFTITIKLAVDQTEAAGKDTLTYGSMTFTRQQDGTFTYTFQLKHEQSIEFSELPHDTQYTITEQTYDGFITTHNGNTGTISDDNPTVVFTNKRQVGALKIVKNVTVNGQPDTPLKSLADGDYTFNVYAFDDAASGKLGAKVTGSPVTITITNGASNSASIGSLPAGKYVIVEQTAANGATLNNKSGDGTDTTTDVDANAVIVTVVADTTAETTEAIGTFTNDLTTTTDVSVEKTFTVVPTEAWSASFQLQSQRRLYSVNGVRATSEQIAAEADVDGEGWTAAAAVSPEVDIALNNAKTSDTVSGLAKYEGVTDSGTTKVYEIRYTVEETALTIGGEDRLEEYNATVTPTSGNSYVISVENRVDDTKTGLTVKKVWQGGNPPADASIDVILGRFKLVEQQPGTITITDSRSGLLGSDIYNVQYTITGGGYTDQVVTSGMSVPAGTYTIAKSVTVDTGKYSNATNASQSRVITVAEGADVTVTFDETVFTPITGTLTISDDYTDAPSGYSVSYRITGPYEYDNTTTSTSVSSLPKGAYTVAKTVTAPSGYTITAYATDSQSVQVNGNGGTATMAKTVFEEQSNPVTVTVKAPIDPRSTSIEVIPGTRVRLYVWVNQYNYSSIAGVSCEVDNTTYYPIQDPTTYNYYISVDFTVNSEKTIILNGTGYSNWGNLNITLSQVSGTPNALTSNRLSRALTRGLKANAAPSTTTGQVTVTTTTITVTNSAADPEYSGYNNVVDDWSKIVTLSNGNNWSAEANKLPKADAEGHEYVYYIVSVTENNVPNGTTVAITTADGKKQVVRGNHADGETAVLSLTDTLPKTSISANKTWVHGDNPVASQPTSVKFTLYEDGSFKDEKTVTSDNDWTVTWDNLELYKADGTLHSYHVTEENVTDYVLTSTTYDSATQTFKLTNTYTPTTTELPVNKEWVFANGSTAWPNGVTVTVTLYKSVGGAEAVSTGLTKQLSAANPSDTFISLPLKEGGQNVTYSVRETGVSFTDATNFTTSVNGTTITNTEKKGNLSLTKVVEGTTDASKEFTFHVTLTARSGGVIDGTYATNKQGVTGTQAVTGGTPFDVTLKAGETWQINYLPVGATWTVTEDGVSGYSFAGVVADGGKTAIENGATVALTATNVYSASTSIQPKAKKLFTNGTINTEQFEFILTEVDNATATEPKSDTTPQSVKVSNDEWNSFTAISYDASIFGDATPRTRTYYYTIREKLPDGLNSPYIDDNGIKYDATIHRLVVTVTDDGKGHLNKVVTLDGKRLKGDDPAVEVTFTNEQLGKLEVTKKITVNNLDFTVPEDEGRTFHVAVYHVTGAGNEEQETLVGVKPITVPKGASQSSTVSFDNLTIGDTYRVYEVTVNGNGAVDRKLANNANYNEYVVTVSDQTVTLAKVTPVTITNDIDTTEIGVDKQWLWINATGDPTNITSNIGTASVTLKLTDGTDDVTADASGTAIAPVTLDGQTDSVETEAWKFKWTNLPKRDSSGNVISYQVVETAASVSDVVGVQSGETLAPADAVLVGKGYTATVTNDLTWMGAKKTWLLNIDGTTVTPDAGTTIVISLKRTLYRDTTPVQDQSNVEIDSVTMTAGENGAMTVRHGSQSTTFESGDEGAWKYTWNRLPTKIVKDNVVYVCKYQVEETSVPDGYNDTTYYYEQTPTQGDRQTITNVKIQYYTLPATGGVGTTTIYIAGASLLMLAVLGFIWLNRKRDDGAGI